MNNPFLSSAFTICTVLHSLLAPSYGPTGLGVMIVTNTNRIILTNSGKIILQYVTVEHPIARYIVNSLKAFHSRYGDGCVSLVLALNASLESVTKSIFTVPAQVSLCQALVHIRDHFFYSRSFIEHLLDQAAKTPVDSLEHLRKSAQDIACTIIDGKFGHLPCYYLSRAIIEWIFKHEKANSVSGITQVLDELIKYSVRMTLTGKNIDDTSVWNGFLINGKPVGPIPQRNTVFPIKFAVLDEDLGTDPKRDEAVAPTVIVSDFASFIASGKHQYNKIGTFLHGLAQVGVRILLCTGSVSEVALGVAREANITIVPYLREEDITRICDHAGIHPIDRISASLVFDSTEFEKQHLGSLADFRAFAHASSQYIHIVLSDDPNSFTLVVCGPSEGLCEQYVEMIDRTLVLLRSWLMWEPPISTDLSDHPDFEEFTRKNSAEVARAKESNKEERESLEGKEKEEKEKKEVEGGKYLYCLAGGCATELDLYFIFQRMEVATKGVSMWLSLAFKILAKAFLSLPARLTRKYTEVNRSFLKELMKLAANHKEGNHQQGFIITSRSHQKMTLETVISEGTGNTLALGIVHPMGLKFEFILHLVDTLIQLLRIDGLYSSVHQ